uniref:Si:ch211-183d21.1 n=1 Tax=Sinocyclocheilus rhinocerous TaxID=307959 RepID=A0A673FYA6_9TELE
MRVELSLVCVALMCVFKQTNSCLIISEVNCDNPKLDTQEFVELYYEGTNPTSLDGYTLVFYNGKVDSAYRVIDLSGHHTDQQGFFIVGSSELTPRPAISLPSNSVQNGPDAIALYGPNWVPVGEGGLVSGVGLLDAVVYTSRRSVDGADGLASVLTPGSVPYVEDEAALEGDESIQRCWQSENLWTFYTGPPTPAWVNHCPVGMATGSYSLVLYDVTTDLISTSVEFIAKEPGIFAVPVNTASLSEKNSAAFALYKGPASDFPKDGPLSHEQPIDAFVYGDSAHMPSDNLTETLIPGRKAFILTDSFLTAGLHASRCGVAEWTRDPGLLVARPRSPGKPNDCIWFQSCPLNMTSFTKSGRIQPPIHSDVDFLLNEINTDSPGGAEDEEFIELWHPSGFRMSLDFIWLVMINGHTGMVYYELELNGYYTDDDGYFLIGSSKVGPDIRIPSNTIQNGPDAIVLYRSKSPPSKEGPNTPRNGLLDAVVYRTRGSDKTVSELTEALTPGQLPLLEDINALPADETLSRCETERLNLNAFRVTSPTPRKQNNCPPKPTIPSPPEGLVINEWGKTSGVNQSQESLFVELTGPPSTPLNGLVLVFFGEDATELNVPIAGSTGSDGLYLVANDSRADQGLPALGHLGAVLLCFEPSGSGFCGSDSRHLDWLVFSDDPKLQRLLQHNMTRFVYTLFSGDSLSRCASDGPVLWIASQPTPRLPNRCPSPAFSSSADLCLQPENNNWQSGSGNCTQEEFAGLLEQLCNCGISSLHVKGVKVSCEAGRLYSQGSVLAVSDQQRERITEILNHNKLSCSAEQGRQVHGAGSSVALVVAALLLFALGAALFVYLYKKRRPADYLSMQLSEQAETPLEL